MTEEANTPREAIARAEAAVQRERWDEALAAYHEAVRSTEDRSDGAAARADALRGAAVVRTRTGDWHEAIRDVAESRLVAARADDRGRIALAENVRGAIEFERGNWGEAERAYASARSHAGSVEDVTLLMEIENNEGALWAARGDRERAERYFRRALDRFEELDLHPCGARALNNLGMVLVDDDRLDEAEDAYERALEVCKRRADLPLAATVMINRARLALEQNDPLRAHSVATTARTFADRIGNGPLAADAACLLGAVSREMGRWDEAERHLDVALARSQGGRAPMAEAEVWLERGELELDLERLDEAIRAFRNARRCYLALGTPSEAEEIEGRIDELMRRASTAEPAPETVA